MKGIDLALEANQRDVSVNVTPMLIDRKIDAKTLKTLFLTSDFAAYFLSENGLLNAYDAIKEATDNKQSNPFKTIIASAKDAQIEISIAADKMSAEITVISAYMGKMPSVEDIFALLKQHDIVKGISRKRIESLLKVASKQAGGSSSFDLIAKGLAPRVGKNSRIKSLVPRAMDRVLVPKYTQDKKVDMRDFGEILCVKSNDAIARRIPPTQGRKGFTVTGKKLVPEPGKWIEMYVGENAYIDPIDDNIVLAKVNGLPKVTRTKVDVDNVYVLNGVNIATGNITFDGSVIVNGDINERMRVTATGSVTVNGFVESASIESGGDIVITQGASGKLENLDCTFKAKGSIYIGHGQGISLETNKNLVVDKQLAYSHVRCSGDLIIGKPANPQGKIFACTIICFKSIRAGHLGAVSGSTLLIDYTEMYTSMTNKHTLLCAEHDKLASQNADHEIRIAKINNHKQTASLTEKIGLMRQELMLEREFLEWLRINVEQSQANIDNFANQAIVSATNKLHPGVSISLNNKHWIAKREYPACSVSFQQREWICTSMR